MYASSSARCHANSPSDRPPGSGRKSYCVAGNALRTFRVWAASRSHEVRNVSSSFMAIAPPGDRNFWFDRKQMLEHPFSWCPKSFTHRERDVIKPEQGTIGLGVCITLSHHHHEAETVISTC